MGAPVCWLVRMRPPGLFAVGALRGSIFSSAEFQTFSGECSASPRHRASEDEGMDDGCSAAEVLARARATAALAAKAIAKFMKKEEKEILPKAQQATGR